MKHDFSQCLSLNEQCERWGTIPSSVPQSVPYRNHDLRYPDFHMPDKFEVPDRYYHNNGKSTDSVVDDKSSSRRNENISGSSHTHDILSLAQSHDDLERESLVHD